MKEQDMKDSSYARAFVESILVSPGLLQGPLEPPPREADWRGKDWELASVSVGPKQYPSDDTSAIWHVIAWRR